MKQKQGGLDPALSCVRGRGRVRWNRPRTKTSAETTVAATSSKAGSAKDLGARLARTSNGRLSYPSRPHRNPCGINYLLVLRQKLARFAIEAKRSEAEGLSTFDRNLGMMASEDANRLERILSALIPELRGQGCARPM
jgi:hypothetical protein